jgi:hypothetical protein
MLKIVQLVVTVLTARHFYLLITSMTDMRDHKAHVADYIPRRLDGAEV